MTERQVYYDYLREEKNQNRLLDPHTYAQAVLLGGLSHAVEPNPLIKSFPGAHSFFNIAARLPETVPFNNKTEGIHGRDTLVLKLVTDCYNPNGYFPWITNKRGAVSSALQRLLVDEGITMGDLDWQSSGFSLDKIYRTLHTSDFIRDETTAEQLDSYDILALSHFDRFIAKYHDDNKITLIPEEDMQMRRKVLDSVQFMKKAYRLMDKQTRRSGEPSFFHALQVAALAVDYHNSRYGYTNKIKQSGDYHDSPDISQIAEVFVLGLLHDVLEDLPEDAGKPHASINGSVLELRDANGAFLAHLELPQHMIPKLYELTDDENPNYLLRFSSPRVSDEARSVKVADRMLNMLQQGPEAKLISVLGKIAETSLVSPGWHLTRRKTSTVRPDGTEGSPMMYDYNHPRLYELDQIRQHHRYPHMELPMIAAGQLVHICELLRPLLVQDLNSNGVHINDLPPQLQKGRDFVVDILSPYHLANMNTTRNRYIPPEYIYTTDQKGNRMCLYPEHLIKNRFPGMVDLNIPDLPINGDNIDQLLGKMISLYGYVEVDSRTGLHVPVPIHGYMY
jgi:hypothetical protein